MSIGIGIDTGGTYTDAVIYDFDNEIVLDSAKALTTKNDLTIGISNVIDKLSIDLLKQASMVGLSTTMATNACVENKGGRAKLILWGIDKHTVERFGKQYGLPDADEIYFQDSYPKFNGGYEKETDWQLFEDNIEKWFKECDAVASVELFAMNTNALVEKKSKEILRDKLGIPVICGNELFTDIDALQRGSSVLLNARLIPIIEEFISAIKTVLKDRNINVPVGIVRSDGSLMSEKFTSVYPVETILCGPAASVMGGVKLSNVPNSFVIDMGGTTTDIAIIKDFVPVTETKGVKIGQWKTFVKGLFIDTFGLGGDSAVRYNNGKMYLDDVRVIPLCVAAGEYPCIIDELKLLEKEDLPHTRFIHEFYILQKDISNNENYTEYEKEFCDKLKNGPMSLRKAAASMESDVYHFKVDRLEKEGVVMRCGLTPTDMMHIKGDFDTYDREASIMGANYVAMCIDEDIDANGLADMVYKEVKRKLYNNVVRCMLENSETYYRENGLDKGMEEFINNCFEKRYSGENGTGYMDTTIKANFKLIGIGAPIHIFLPDVAKMLYTECIIPEYSSVANALGAINGNVIVKSSLEIKPVMGGGFDLFGKTENLHFKTLPETKEYAVKILKEYTYNEAIERGSGPDVTYNVMYDDIKSKAKGDVVVYLGTTVYVTAMGRIMF